MSATDDNINAIMAMGFPKDQAVIALNRSGNDVNAAADLLSRGG